MFQAFNRFMDGQPDIVLVLIILAVFLLLTIIQRMNRRDALSHIPAVQVFDKAVYLVTMIVVAGGIVAILLWR